MNAMHDQDARSHLWVFSLTFLLPFSLYASPPDWQASGTISVDQSHQVSDDIVLAQPLHLTVAADQAVIFEGDLSANFGPTTGLVKRGQGQLALHSNNPAFYTGMELVEGTLALEHPQPFGNDQYLIGLHTGTRLHYGDGTRLFRGINTLGRPGDPAIRLQVAAGVAYQQGRIHGDVAMHKTGAGILWLGSRAESADASWHVQAGGLQIDDFGYINGPVVVHEGAWLGGNGTVGAVHLESGGWLRPAGDAQHNIGWDDPVTLHIERGLTLDAGSHLALRTWADGRNDAIRITAGDARLDGQLHIHPQGNADDWQLAQDYLLVDSALGLNGSEFAQVSTAVPYLASSVRMTPNQVWLTLHPETASPQPESPGQPAARPSAWQASLASQLIEDSRFVREAAMLSSHEPTGAWARSFYATGRTQSQGALARDRRHAEGLFVGSTIRPTPNWTLGWLAGYHHSRHQQSTADRARSRIHHYHLGLTAAWENNRGALQLGLTHSWHRATTRRQAAVEHLSHTVNAHSRATTRQLFAQARLKLSHVEPFIQTARVQQHQPAISESGGPLAMHYERQKRHIHVHSVGLRGQKDWTRGAKTLSISSQLAWHRITGKRRSAGWQVYRDDPQQTRLSAPGKSLAKNYWQWDIGLSSQWRPSLQWQLAYQLTGAHKIRDHGAMASLQFAW